MTGLLLRMAGVSAKKAARTEITPELGALLDQVARDFLRAGGTFSAADWIGMSPRERAAAKAAGEAITAERIAKFVCAAKGPRGLAEVSQDFDGGAALARLEESAVLSALSHLDHDTLAELRRR